MKCSKKQGISNIFKVLFLALKWLNYFETFVICQYKSHSNVKNFIQHFRNLEPKIITFMKYKNVKFYITVGILKLCGIVVFACAKSLKPL